MPNETVNLEDKYKTIVFIWAALLMSQFMFVVLVFVVKPELLAFDFAKPLLGDNPPIVLAFAAVSFFDLALSFVFRKRFLSKSVTEQNVGMVQTAMIVSCALSEAISLFGILLGIAFSYQYFFLFIALGITGIVLHFPRRESLHAASFKQVRS